MRGPLVSLGILVSTLMSSGAWAAGPAFMAYPAVVQHGNTAMPAFKGSQRPYAAYRTRIRESVAAGVRFGGHYAFVVIGCGAGCRFGYITDLKTGIVHDLPLGGEDYRSLVYEARPDSRLLKAQWERYGDDGAFAGCALQDFVWDGKAFKTLGAPRTTDGNCPPTDEVG